MSNKKEVNIEKVYAEFDKAPLLARVDAFNKLKGHINEALTAESERLSSEAEQFESIKEQINK